MPLSDHFPDPRFPAAADIRNRWRYTRSSAGTSHSTLAVGNEQTTRVREPLRIRQMKVGEVSGGTVTVQVKANGRDIFPDGNRPVSGGRPTKPHRKGSYIIPAGSILTTIIEATSGVPAGTAAVVIDTEPFTLLPKNAPVKLKGKDRLRPSRRQEAAFLNTLEGQEEQQAAAVGAAGTTRTTTTTARTQAGVVVPPKFQNPRGIGPRPPRV